MRERREKSTTTRKAAELGDRWKKSEGNKKPKKAYE